MRFSYAQFGTSFNYVNVNTQTFTVPASYMGGSNQNAYNLSVLDMSQRLSAIYNNGAFNTNYNMNLLIKVKKVKFSPDSVRMMIIQPIYNASIKKRCALISPGNSETFNIWYLTNRYAIDLALRGYIVAYYENAGSTNANLNNSGKNTAQYFTDKVINVCNTVPYNTDRDKFFTTMFINLFISNEARKYVVNNSTALQVDTTKLFLVGSSLGANTALFYGYGSNNNWTSNTTYNCVKNILNYSNPISNKGIRGIMSMGGGLPAPTEALGNVITSDDNIPSIWFAGAGDIAVNPNISNVLGPEIWGANASKFLLQNNNIKHNIYINCFGVHSFETPSFDDPNTSEWTNTLPSNTISGNTNFPFNTNLSNLQITNYVNSNFQNLLLYQYTEFQSYQALTTTATYFNNIINSTMPSDVINFIRPTQIQNSPFYKYSIGGYTLEQAVLGYYTCQQNQPICLFSGAHEYDNIAKNNLNATFITSNECNILPNNYGENNLMIVEDNLQTNSRQKFEIKDDLFKDTGTIRVMFISRDKIEFTVLKNINPNCSLEFFDVLGNKLMEQNLLSSNEDQNISIDIAHHLNQFPSGIYFCVIRCGNDVKTFKFFHNK